MQEHGVFTPDPRLARLDARTEKPAPVHTGQVPKKKQPATTVREQAAVVPAITRAALDAGHEPRVERVGARFKLVCSCGWSTASSSSRKTAFQAVAQHVWEVGHQHLDTPEIVDHPQVVGGRG